MVERQDWVESPVEAEKPSTAESPQPAERGNGDAGLVTTTQHGQRRITRPDWVDGEPEQVLTPVRYGDDPAEPAEETHGLPQAVAEDWRESGGIEHHREIAVGHITSITEGLNDQDARDLVQGFDRLPESAQAAILLEISLEPRWGGGEEHAQDRLDRIEERLSEDDAEQVVDWLATMSDETKARVMGVLGGN